MREVFTVRFEDEAQYRAFSGKDISVTFDSENTITYQTVTMPDLSSINSTELQLTVPYLFFQNFSGIPSFSDGHDNPKVGTHSDTYKGITELSSLTSVLSGWYGTRIGGQEATAIRICCRYEHFALAGAYYKGRVYTPFLTNIKDGKSVKISVSFRHGSNISEYNSAFWVDEPKANPMLYFGISSQDPVINPDQSSGDLIDSITGMVAGTGFSNAVPSSLSPMVIRGEALSISGGSYTSFNSTKTVEVSNVDNGMRLGWIISSTNTVANANGNYWLYLDDIKVQIVK